MGSWCKMSDGEDFDAVICSTPFDSNTVSFTHLLTNTAGAINDDVFLGGCEASEENPLHNPTFFSTEEEFRKKQGCNKILPLGVTKQEPASAENIESVAFESEKVVDCISTTTKTLKNPHGLTSKIPGTRKRKSQQRRIMQIPMAEGSWNKQGGAGVPSDLWSWRKYGQKPIKGSPYPRGYYRCSSSKGCPARKQLERSFTDPTKLVITYTEDHNHAWPTHRGALARSSAQNSLEEKTVQPVSLVVPHTSDSGRAKDNDDAASPPTESQQEKQRANSEVVESSFEEEDPYLGDNHMFEDNLFADFGDPPELDNKDFSNHSDEEDGSTTVDPFNLFDWSFFYERNANS